MKSYLKVKIKSLAEEATIIRCEERRVKRSIKWWQSNAAVAPEGTPEVEGVKTTTETNYQNAVDSYRQEYFGLHSHRTHIVRDESRAAQLAYAFINGYAYSHVEDPEKTRKPVPILKVAELVLRYSPSTIPFALNGPGAIKKRQDHARAVIEHWFAGKQVQRAKSTESV